MENNREQTTEDRATKGGTSKDKELVQQFESELKDFEAELVQIKRDPSGLDPFLSRVHWLHIRILSIVKDEKDQNQLRLRLYYLVHQLSEYYIASKRPSDYDHASKITEALLKEYSDLSGARATLENDRQKIEKAMRHNQRVTRNNLMPVLLFGFFLLLMPVGKTNPGQTIGQALYSHLFAPHEKFQALPENGYLFMSADSADCSQLTVDCSNTDAAYVKLKTLSGETVVAFFVRAGETATIDVPREVLELYFAQDAGHTRKWYGEEKCFGFGTAFAKNVEPMDFTQYYHTVIFHTLNGNMKVSRIGSDDF